MLRKKSAHSILLSLLLTLNFLGCQWAFASEQSAEMIRAGQLFDDDLQFLKTLRFENTSPLFKKIFQPQPSSEVSDFFSQRIKSKWWDEDAPPLQVASTDPGTGILYLTHGYNSDLNAVDRISAIIHEARHVDGDGYFHVNCPSLNVININDRSYSVPTYGLSNACDTHQFGAYAIQYIFLRGIVDSCTNCSKEIKDNAEISANHYLTRILSAEYIKNLVQGASLNSQASFRSAENYFRALETQNENPIYFNRSHYCIAGKTDSGFSYLNTQANFDLSALKKVRDGALIELLGLGPVSFKGKISEGVKLKVINNNPSLGAFDIAAPGEILWAYKDTFSCHGYDMNKINLP